MSRKHDVKEHIKGQKHINNVEKKNKTDSMRIFVKNQASVRSEIIWALLTVYRNLSFKISDYIALYMPHIYTDSKLASQSTINRHKTKKSSKKFLLVHWR